MVHGDDVPALGTPEMLDLYERGLQQSFDCKLRGRIGEDPVDLKEVRVLNRILRLTTDGLLYEGDPRHAERLGKAIGIVDCKRISTPGVKWVDNGDGDGDAVMDSEEPETPPDVVAPDSSRPRWRCMENEPPMMG